ncbi:NAD(P)-binding protein [Coniochaeta ligniaria NRRL 30616]|uniref:NAD(P)-binding protein n=1 Tax=Coniochaeta ligniaria NRRL 30616 TaxID=1408157 RepID=A0A1J7JTR4_9PEZI|nr:NAD(P)-binding protein [Coniochaeta ligniaria NRRL 30616]
MTSLSAQGKTALITGAGGGLGKVIAETFLLAGANVVICDINPSRVSAVQDEWSATDSYAGRFLVRQADVTSEESLQSLVDAVVAQFGRLDVLVNNAGVMDDFTPVGACPRVEWDRVIGVNLTGTYLATKIAVNQMEAQEPKGGSIINIGSNASYRGMSSGVAYTVSKAGVVGLTKNTAGFYGPKGIYCSALLLGGMADTNIAEGMARGQYFHHEMFQAVSESQSRFDPATKSLPLASVAKYILFLTDGDIAVNANGSCIVYNRNWPEA